MTLSEARAILNAHNDWRRGLPPYDAPYPVPEPHLPSQVGLAIDVLLANTEPPASEAVQVPDEMQPYGENDSDLDAYSYGYELGKVEGWNACRAVMLAVKP